jgi:mycothiol synthase
MNMANNEITIRNYKVGDVPALVGLINEADAIDKLERATTVREMEHELSIPTAHPETDCLLAWEGDKLVGYADLYVRAGDVNNDGIIYCWGVVHPQWRRRGLGRRLLEAAYDGASSYADEIAEGGINFHCGARDVEQDRMALFEGFGMEQVRYFVNLARSLNGNLPEVKLPAGIRLRAFDPERDAETVWRVDDSAFRDHWGYTESKLEDFLHWIELPHLRPELWYLAEDEATNEVVGLSLSLIDPDWIAQTGRQEGYVDTLAVLREYRRRGLGSALLAQSLHALSGAGMEAAHLHADTDNLTGAMRLYESAGFRVRKTSVSYRKVIREG